MKRIVTFIMIAGIILAASSPLHAFSLVFDTKTYARFMNNFYTVGQTDDFYAPIYEYGNLHMYDVGVKNLSMHAYGWMRGDFIQRDNEQRFDGALMFGYLNYVNDRVDLKAGRIFLTGAASTGRSIYFDGAQFRTDIAKGFGLEIFGGSPINSVTEGRSGDLLYGARAFWVGGSDKVEIGLSYFGQRDDWQRSFEYLGIDFWTHPTSDVEVSGRISFDYIARSVYDAAVDLSWKITPKLKSSTYYERTVPSQFLPKNSIFWVFSNESINAFGQYLTYRATDRWNLKIDGKLRVYSGEWVGYEVGGSASYVYLPRTRSMLGFGIARLDEVESGYVKLRAFMRHNFSKRLNLSADFFTYFYDDAINNRQYSLDFFASLGWEIFDNFEVMASAEALSNPYYSSDLRGLLRLSYHLGKSW